MARRPSSADALVLSAAPLLRADRRGALGRSATSPRPIVACLDQHRRGV